VYGEPRVQDRHLMWALLRRIKPCHTVLGSWWEILRKLFGLWSTFHQIEDQKKQMQDFRDVLSDSNLRDIGFRGLPWTFHNKQKGDRNVKVRLDRAVASPCWSQCFPGARAQHVITSRSDHCPLFLELELV
jgi:hypothetical protein